MCSSKLLKGFHEYASLPLPGTAQREGSEFWDANEQFDWMLFISISTHFELCTGFVL